MLSGNKDKNKRNNPSEFTAHAAEYIVCFQEYMKRSIKSNIQSRPAMRVLLLLLLPLLTPSSYVPGTPGGPWSMEEVLAVKAKVRRTFAMGGFEAIRDALLALGEPSDAIYNSTVYWGGTFPSAPKLLRIGIQLCRY